MNQFFFFFQFSASGSGMQILQSSGPGATDSGGLQPSKAHSCHSPPYLPLLVPVMTPMKFKNFVLAYRAVDGTGPPYLQSVFKHPPHLTFLLMGSISVSITQSS